MKHDIRHEDDGLLAHAGGVVALQSALDRMMNIVDGRCEGYSFTPEEAQEPCSMERIAGLWEELSGMSKYFAFHNYSLRRRPA